MSFSSVLYYPTIEFRNDDYKWLLASSLFWDRIYRIVPSDYKPNDSKDIRILCESDEIGVPINPNIYSTECSELFMENINLKTWHASAMNYDKSDPSKYTKIHLEKLGISLSKILLDDKRSHNDDWILVPNVLAGLYMSYLSRFIAQKNDLSLATSSPAFWSASSYYEYQDALKPRYYYNNDKIRDSNALISLMINEFVPANIMDITPHQILEFRTKRIDERKRLLDEINNAQKELAKIQDPRVIKDFIDEKKKDIDSALEQYKKSADILNVNKWTGLISAFILLAASVLDVFGINQHVISAFNASGCGIGFISGVSSHNRNIKMRNQVDNPYLYLSEINRSFSDSLDFNEYNRHLSNRINEFIND